MAFDLGTAMRKKAEQESARLVDFTFRRRVRATRALVRTLGLDDAFAARLVATLDEDAALAMLADRTGQPLATLAERYRAAETAAHADLVAAEGDPTPQRLA